VRALIEAYLGDEHLASCARGCPVAALGAEMARQNEALLIGARSRVDGLVQRVSTTLGPDTPPARAFLLASTLVGVLQLARTLGSSAGSLLAASREDLIRQYDQPRPEA
jgi:hypothetical protein